jgi:hypothetical protein
VLASVVLAGCLGLVPSPAAAFGTIEGGGQNREHDRITRAAVACPARTGSNDTCFEPRSADQLAGHGRKFGAVGSPDLTEVPEPAAHCDDADFLGSGYPRMRDEASASLLDCVGHLRRGFREAADEAGGLLDDNGHLVAAEVSLDIDCELTDREERAKCRSLEGFGRALHGVQDFYSHSNWADEADPARPIGADNPPGLNLPAPSPVLDLRGSGAPSVPPDLTTGCYVLHDRVPGVGVCERRITHAGLNKDLGLVDPRTGTTASPMTPRGKVGSNFAKAVAGAIVETRHQWREFRAALNSDYGTVKASLMVCALTRDDPANDCVRQGWAAALAVGGVLVGAGAVALLMMGPYRRRRTGRPARRRP